MYEFSDLDENKLYYNLFLYEQELYNEINRISVEALTESVTLQSVQEAFQDTVVNYINKVNNNIQVVYNKFVTKVGGNKDMTYLAKAAEKISNANPRFTINNFGVYDFVVFKNYKVLRYDRRMLSEYLKTQKEFTKKYYPTLYSEGNKNNMNVMMSKNVVKGYNSIRCDKKGLVRCYNFCSETFFDLRKSIDDDIKVINEAGNTIINDLNVVRSAVESTAFCESIILEVINNPNNPNHSTKLTFTDTDGTKSQPGDKTAENQNSILNQIVNYMKVSTLLISAKMRTLSKAFKMNMDVVKHYVDVPQSENTSRATSDRKVSQIVTQTSH